MGQALADANAGEVRVLMWPFLILLVGPPLTAVWITGVVALLRRPQWRPARAFAVALPVVVLLTFAAGSQFYYPFGLVLALFAAGCVPVGEWLANRTRRIWAVVLVAVNGVVSALIALPLVPVAAVGDTPVPGINQTAGDTVGWPTYVDQVAAAFAATDRDRTVVITANYGEAGRDRGVRTRRSASRRCTAGTTNSGWPPLRRSRPPTPCWSASDPAPRACSRRAGRSANWTIWSVSTTRSRATAIVHCVGRTDTWAALWPHFQH